MDPQVAKHHELMRQRKRERDKVRRRLETIETRKKVASGEIAVHPEAVRARKRRLARWNKQAAPDEANVASILVGLTADNKCL